MAERMYRGGCFCGAVQIAVSGAPSAQGFCHCSSCRSWSAAPVNAFTLWPSDAVLVTRGEERIGEFHKTERSYRKFCTTCGGHLMTAHPGWGLVDVYSAVLVELKHEPQVHVNYQESVLRMRDGLPKMKDLPLDMGGSGETLPE